MFHMTLTNLPIEKILSNFIFTSYNFLCKCKKPFLQSETCLSRARVVLDINTMRKLRGLQLPLYKISQKPYIITHHKGMGGQANKEINISTKNDVKTFWLIEPHIQFHCLGVFAYQNREPSVEKEQRISNFPLLNQFCSQ